MERSEIRLFTPYWVSLTRDEEFRYGFSDRCAIPLGFGGWARNSEGPGSPLVRPSTHNPNGINCALRLPGWRRTVLGLTVGEAWCPIVLRPERFAAPWEEEQARRRRTSMEYAFRAEAQRRDYEDFSQAVQRIETLASEISPVTLVAHPEAKLVSMRLEDLQNLVGAAFAATLNLDTADDH